MNPDNSAIPVVFRMWKAHPRTCIALFPTLTWNYSGTECGSYEHVGQHGGADYAGVIERTRPATPDEYAALKRELEGAPFYYRLKVCRRKPK